MNKSVVQWGLVEAAFVVAGILIAFSIDAWWDELQERRVEDAVLESLAGEVARNQAMLRSDLLETNRHLEHIDQFLRATPLELGQVHPDSVRAFTGAIVIPLTFDPETAVAEMLMGRSALDEEGLAVREITGRWLRMQSDMEEQATTLWSLGVGLWPVLARHSLPYASDGLDFMTLMHARIGPQGLSRVREDEELVAEIMVKGQMQRTMQGNWRAARPCLIRWPAQWPLPDSEVHLTDSEFCWRGLPGDKSEAYTITDHRRLPFTWSEPRRALYVRLLGGRPILPATGAAAIPC